MTAAQRKQTPHIYHGMTTSLCEECYDLVPTKILFEGGNVYYQKRCKEHGVQKTLIATDIEYYKNIKSFVKPGDLPQNFATKTKWGCPLDCGLCPDHEQHSCLALIEINEECNLKCPVCFASSSPDNKKSLSLETIERMMDTLVKSEGMADVLQISGGEPTIHPQILDILALAKSKNILHLMLNTNGVRIAKDKEFVAELAKFMPGFEIYLQFDSFKKESLENLRGIDLSTIRRKALENLEEAGISTTLVMTVKKGINDDEVGAVLEHALQYECVRGVTYQPLQDAGRNENFDKNRDRMTLTDIRTGILDQCDLFAPKDIIPLPCNPESIAMAYGLRKGADMTPVTSLIPKEQLVEATPNAVTFEKNEDLKKLVYDLYSLSSGDINTPERMGQLLCCLPKVPVLEDLSYKNIFRVTIVQFMDRFNFCLAGVKRSCIHFVTPEEKIIPFDTYNLFYRDGLVDELRKRKG